MTRWLDKFQQNHELNFSAIYFELIITHPTEKKDVFCGYAAATPVDKRSIHLCINWKHNGCFFHAPFPLWKIFSWSCWNSNISIYQSKIEKAFRWLLVYQKMPMAVWLPIDKIFIEFWKRVEVFCMLHKNCDMTSHPTWRILITWKPFLWLFSVHISLCFISHPTVSSGLRPWRGTVSI